MKKVFTAILIFVLSGCSTTNIHEEVRAKKQEAEVFGYKYEILDVGIFGKVEPSVSVVVQVDNRFVAVDIDDALTEVPYEKLIGSMLYSTKPVDDINYKNQYKIREK